MASSSSLASTSSQKHIVYFSYHMEDPLKHVPEVISQSLNIRGVSTFKDAQQFKGKQVGVDLGRSIREAIGIAKICVVFISKDYVYSIWCLEELVEILRCRKKWGLVIVPIFYDIDPSDVRKQRGEAFSIVNGQTKGGLWWTRWKSALKDVANICGWDNRHSRHPSPSMFVGDIVKDILDRQIPSIFTISLYPVRFDSCDQYLNLFLHAGMDDVIVQGICGPSGMGKTAIAKSIYDDICWTYDGSCFLPTISTSSRMSGGLVQLQEKLLSDILGEDVEISDITRGMNVIKEELCFKRVLIILDDIDDMDQLQALAGERSWFGLGSKIIITSKSYSLLKMFGADQIFSARGNPLPSNIQVIWKQYLQSRRIIARLNQYIEDMKELTTITERYLNATLLQERQRNVTQEEMAANLKLYQERSSSRRVMNQPNLQLMELDPND